MIEPWNHVYEIEVNRTNSLFINFLVYYKFLYLRDTEYLNHWHHYSVHYVHIIIITLSNHNPNILILIKSNYNF